MLICVLFYVFFYSQIHFNNYYLYYDCSDCEKRPWIGFLPEEHFYTIVFYILFNRGSTTSSVVEDMRTHTPNNHLICSLLLYKHIETFPTTI